MLTVYPVSSFSQCIYNPQCNSEYISQKITSEKADRVSCSPRYTKRSNGGVAEYQKLHMCSEDQQRPLEFDMKITSDVTKEMVVVLR